MINIIIGWFCYIKIIIEVLSDIVGVLDIIGLLGCVNFCDVICSWVYSEFMDVLD